MHEMSQHITQEISNKYNSLFQQQERIYEDVVRVEVAKAAAGKRKESNNSNNVCLN